MRDNERFIVDLNKKRETAWQQLYEEFYPALCTYVAKLTHENVGVEDIVQECMIGLWDSSLQFPNVKSLAGWLYKAVYNQYAHRQGLEARDLRGGRSDHPQKAPSRRQLRFLR